MTKHRIRELIVIGVFFFALTSVFAQGKTPSQQVDATPLIFTNLNDLWAHTDKNSTSLQNNTVRLEQAQKAKLAAVLSTIDFNGNLLSAQFTDNTKLGVNLFPAEIFGGAPGTFREVQLGVQYNTNLNNSIDIKLVNPDGWSNLKLAKINIDLTESNNLLTVKSLHENIANNFYNIVNLQKQILSSRQNLAISDTLFQIANDKFKEGLVRQQDLNDAKIIYLNTQESIVQLEYLLDQYYISLKILCDIPEKSTVEIQESGAPQTLASKPIIALNEVSLKNYMLREDYARTNFNRTRALFLPTLSLQLSNSNNLYNTEFEPFTGNWINSNYIGLRFNMPLPNPQSITKRVNAKYEYQLAQNNTEQARTKRDLDQRSLEIEYQKTVSQVESNQEILALRRDSYFKNKNLYQEGIISLDQAINSYNAMITAEYNLISSEVNVKLSLSKIDINNNLK